MTEATCMAKLRWTCSKKLAIKGPIAINNKHINDFNNMSRVQAVFKSPSNTSDFCTMYCSEPVCDKISKRCNIIAIIAIIAKSVGVSIRARISVLTRPMRRLINLAPLEKAALANNPFAAITG